MLYPQASLFCISLSGIISNNVITPFFIKSYEKNVTSACIALFCPVINYFLFGYNNTTQSPRGMIRMNLTDSETEMQASADLWLLPVDLAKIPGKGESLGPGPCLVSLSVNKAIALAQGCCNSFQMRTFFR